MLGIDNWGDRVYLENTNMTLADIEGDVKLFRTHSNSAQWTVTYAGSGKAYLTSSSNLQLDSGSLSDVLSGIFFLTSHRNDFLGSAKWTVTKAGSGKVYLNSYVSNLDERLVACGGEVYLTTQYNTRGSAAWTVSLLEMPVPVATGS